MIYLYIYIAGFLIAFIWQTWDNRLEQIQIRLAVGIASGLFWPLAVIAIPAYLIYIYVMIWLD